MKRASAKRQAKGDAIPGSGKPKASCATSGAAAIAHGSDHGVPRPLGQYASWEPEAATSSASATSTAVTPVGDISALVSAVDLRGGDAGAIAAAASLCAALRQGGHDLAEAACEHGAVEASLALLGGLRSTGEGGTRLARAATEALWYLCDDYDSCQRVIRGSGHELLFRLAREQGPVDAAVAAGAFQLLTSTLYCEARGSEVWRAVDAGLFVEALEWALRTHGSEAPAGGAGGAEGGCALGFVCDVAALWVLRACGLAGPQAARPLLRVVPKLLARMAAAQDDPYLQQHGCRLLWSLASACREWPEDVHDPAMAALTQLAVPLQFCANPETRAYSGMALQAVAALKEGRSAASLSSMD